MAERTWVNRGGRPDWITDDEVELVAERVRMALAEVGLPITWRDDPDPRCVKIADEVYDEPRKVALDQARRLAMASIGAVEVEGERYW